MDGQKTGDADQNYGREDFFESFNFFPEDIQPADVIVHWHNQSAKKLE